MVLVKQDEHDIIVIYTTWFALQNHGGNETCSVINKHLNREIKV